MISYHLSSPETTDLSGYGDNFIVFDGESILAIRSILLQRQWSPIIWRNGERKSIHFIMARFLGLDFENEDVPITRIHEQFKDHWHILGTTRNHQRPKKGVTCDRFRLLLRWERPITDVLEYKKNVADMIDLFGADRQGSDGARMFRPCTEIVSWNSKGRDMEVVNIDHAAERRRHEERIAKYDRMTSRRLSYGRLPPFSERWLTLVIPQGERNDTCFVIGCELKRTGIDYEDAVRRILASPTYVGGVSQEIHKEIRNTVLSAYRRA